MPVGMIIGFAVFALEIVGLGWLLHWWLAGSENWMVVAVAVLIAVPVTALAVASVMVADRSDDGMDEYLSRDRLRSGPAHGIPSVNASAARATSGEPSADRAPMGLPLLPLDISG